MGALRDLRAYLTRRARGEEFIASLDALGVDDDTRRALLMLPAVGMPANSIERLAMAYAKGQRIEVISDHHPGPPTPGVHGARRRP